MQYVQRLLLAVLIVGLAGLYFLWPYFEIRRFAAAVNKNDTETVKRMVDVDELRASFETLVVDALVLVASDKGGPIDPAIVRSKSREFIESPQGKALLDQKMSADALATAFSTNQNGKEVPMTWKNEHWHSPWEFRVQDSESSAHLIMKFKGTRWKVTGFEVPESDLRKFLAKQSQFPARASGSPLR